MRLEGNARERRSAAQRVADAITAAAGSTPFLILHVVWFTGWMLMNTGRIPGLSPFDPFPFSFLTLTVSLEAIFLTLLIIMSQNHMMKEADKRAHLDLQVNMLAEQESTLALRMLRKICHHLGIEEDDGDETSELEAETDIDALAETLEQKMPS